MRKVLAILSVSAFLLFSSPVFISSMDDFDLLPPPDAEGDFLAFPDDLGGDSPPPLEDFSAEGGDLALPPLEDVSAEGGDLALPPLEDFSAEGGDLALPPLEDASAESGDLALPALEDDFAESGDLALPSLESEEEMVPPPPAKQAAKKTAEKTSAPAAGSSRYTVVKGDSLWKISGKRSIYGDSFKWPLLFRANRNIIEDPDLIYPRQNLQVRKNFTAEEVKDAVKKAKETPPYEPRTAPRKQLPIKY